MNDQVDSDQHGEESPAEATTRRLITLAVPPIDRLLVLLGACAMVLSALLSWIELAPDAFPNFAGIGVGGGGVGLIVLLAGIALLSGRPSVDTATGVALGAFLSSLVAVTLLVDESGGLAMGAGAWVAMVGSVLALAGVVFAAVDPSRRPARHVTHSAVASLGAGLAAVASFWLDWPVGPLSSSAGSPFTSGLDSDVRTGYAVLILGGLSLLLLLGLRSPTTSPGTRATMAMYIRVAGIAICALAAAEIAGSLMSSVWTGSGPVLALIGAVAIVRSVGSADGAAADETADVDAV